MFLNVHKYAHSERITRDTRINYRLLFVREQRAPELYIYVFFFLKIFYLTPHKTLVRSRPSRKSFAIRFC